MTTLQFHYGDHASQFIRVLLPENTLVLPIIPVFIIHGGYWNEYYTVDNSYIDSLPQYFLSQYKDSSYNFAVCLLEYRRCLKGTKNLQTGWPNTNLDIILGMNKFYNLNIEVKFNNISLLYHVEQQENWNFDMNLSIVLGHSAGATLALWICSTRDNEILSFPPMLFSPFLCVALAPISDLILGHQMRLSDKGDAISEYMHHPPVASLPSILSPSTHNESEEGTSEECTHCGGVCHYSLASPSHLIPLRNSCLVVGGLSDGIVPPLFSSLYFETIQAGAGEHPSPPPSVIGDESPPPQPSPSHPQTKLLLIEGANHFDLVRSSSHAWDQIYQAITSFLPAR